MQLSSRESGCKIGKTDAAALNAPFVRLKQKDTPAGPRQSADESGRDRLVVGALDGPDDLRGDVLYSIQRHLERLALAVVKLNVVARGRACLQLAFRACTHSQ